MRRPALRTAGTLAAMAALAATACTEPSPLPASAPAAPGGPSPAAARCVSIVGWNDLHGQLVPDTPVFSTGRVPAGGVAAIGDAVASVRATGDAVVVVTAGDDYTGRMSSTLAEGAPVVQAYRLLGVDAAALGNHDFDFGPVGYDRVTAPPGTGDDAGPDGPRGALLARMAEAGYPFLSANLARKGGAPVGWPGLRAWTMVERGGFRVGVVGYTTRDTPATTLKPNVADLDFHTNAAARVAAAIREARAAGASPVVIAAHASIEGELPQALGDAAPHPGELTDLVAGLGADRPDLIVGGHRHAWLLGRVAGVPLVTTDWHGIGVSRSRFCTPEGGGPPRLVSVERLATLASTPPVSTLGAQVAAAMEPWEQKVKALATEQVAVLSKACEVKGPEGTVLADQVARTQRENVALAAAPPAGVPVVGLTNIGALRTSLGPGAVRVEDVFAFLPFENTVAACGTTRAGLARFLENGLKKDPSRERFPFGVAGARVKVKRAADKRLSLVSVDVEGQPADAKPDAPVWLAISDFMLGGGDDLLDGVKCAPAVASPTRIRDLWRRVLEREQSCDGPSKNVVLEP